MQDTHNYKVVHLARVAAGRQTWHTVKKKTRGCNYLGCLAGYYLKSPCLKASILFLPITWLSFSFMSLSSHFLFLCSDKPLGYLTVKT